MADIVRLGDTSDHRGYMLTASATWTVNGIPVCLDGDIHRCPAHGDWPVHSSKTLNCSGTSVVKTGNKAECGAELITGGSVSTD